MTIFKGIKTEAKALRSELQKLTPAVEINHGHALDLAARAKGATDWNTYAAQMLRRYFYDRHEPYLPNRLSLVCALSVRKAALADATDIELSTRKSSDGCHYQFVYAEAIERTLRQVQTCLAGTALVAPKLLAALKKARTRSVSALLADEILAEQELEAVMTIRDRNTFDAALSMTYSQAEAYSEAYMKWRLATLAASLAQYERRSKGERSFADLAQKETDLYALVGELVHPIKLGLSMEMNHEERRFARSKGKAVLFSIQANGSLEPSLMYHAGVSLSDRDVDVCTREVLRRFPEFPLWHAWAELKPLLAEGIDSVQP